MGRATSGFFATPPSVITLLPSLLTNPHNHPGRLLDPCAGQGIAASYLSAHLKLDPYLIELDRQRAAQCQSRVGRVLRSDAAKCKVQREAFSVLFLNPPYDSAGHGQRTEFTWLKRWTPMLQPEGLLVYIIPERQYTETVLEYLSTYYRDVSLYHFPAADYETFEQTIFIGKRVRTPNPSQTVRNRLWSALRRHDLPELGSLTSSIAYEIPDLSYRGEIEFRSTWLDPEEMYAEAHERGLWQDPHVQDLLTFHHLKPVRPLLPLRKGHLTRMITAGLYNNTTLRQGGRHWIIKGRARKQTKELSPIVDIVHTKDGPEERTQYRTIESYVPEIRAFDLTEGPMFGNYIVVEC
ncbi:MAG TPA: DUF6094 domain-containing protein [Nitrospira sp.]|nr:DUF6094 domain-containing protein [Nitrospira sp.]